MPATFYNNEAKIWHGAVVETRFGPSDSIGSVVLKSMLENPDNVAQICHQSGKQFTNMEILKHSIQVAQHFEKLQLKQGDIIGLCVANSDYLAPLFFGAMFCGLCVSTMEANSDDDEIKHIYSMTRPQIMFCESDNYSRVREAFGECGLSSNTLIFTVHKHVAGARSMLEFFEEAPAPAEEFRVPSLEKGPHQTALIVCTSGTTGLPKGVTLSHAALLHGLRSQHVSHIRVLTFSSLFWLSGVTAVIHGTIAGATRIISENPFSANEFFEIVQRYKVNVWAGSPKQMALSLASDKLAESDLSSIRLYIIGGCAASYALIEKFKRFATNATFTTVYATSESCVNISGGVCEPNNSVGQLDENIEVTVIDDGGLHLGPNETGEICVRCKFPWAGYFNNPAATKAIYDEDGWIHSGDMGYFNDDGQLFLVDRKTDIKNYDNFQFSPTDIEKVIDELPEVANVCVVGITDRIHGYLPAAAVTKRFGFNIEKSEIYQHVAERMQDHEHLRGGVYFFESLPQNASGKTIRHKVAEICEGIWIECPAAK